MKNATTGREVAGSSVGNATFSLTEVAERKNSLYGRA